MKKLNAFVWAVLIGSTLIGTECVWAQAKRAGTTTSQPARPASRPATQPARPAAQPTRPATVPRVAASRPQTTRPANTNNTSRSNRPNTNTANNNTARPNTNATPASTTPAPNSTAAETTTPKPPVNNRSLVLTAKEDCFIRVNDGEEIQIPKDVPTTIGVAQSANKITIRTVVPAMTWTQDVTNVNRGAKKDVEINFIPWYQARLNQMEQERLASQVAVNTTQLQARPTPETLTPVTPNTNASTNTVTPSATTTTNLPPSSPQKGESWTNSVGISFIWIPEGTFQMGKPGNIDDSQAHEVTLTKGFWMSKNEVTQAQWQALMGNNPSDFKGENRPVENVTFTEVITFIQKLNEKEGFEKYQLPTEAQWEYAARSGTDTKYTWGNRIDKNRANCLDCGSPYDGKETAPVGSFFPSSWGLYDMHGNVMEWVQDWYAEKYYATPDSRRDPKGPTSGEGRVIRGGGYDINSDDLQTHIRGFVPESFKRNDLGFRLVLNAQ